MNTDLIHDVISGYGTSPDVGISRRQQRALTLILQAALVSAR